MAVWIPATDRDAVEIRLTRLETGAVEGSTRVGVERGTEPVTLARSITGGALELLARLGTLPEWDDPLGGAGAPGPNVGGRSRVPMEVQGYFLRGLTAEEVWNWEGARRGYQQSLAIEPDFHEARTLLARAARLRLGGTLAEG